MTKIALNTNTIDDAEIEAATAVLKSGYMTMGKLCLEFETAFASYVGAKHAVFVNSGSSANLLTFFTLANPQLPTSSGKQRLEPGSEVIVPAVTWSTTIWPIIQAGCVPVLVDSGKYNLQIDVSAVESAVTDKTRAICPVHVLGNAAEIAKLKQLADKHNLWLIEDTCESLGVRHQDKYVGTWGDIGTFSFFFSHHISTIEGGMIVTQDDAIADMLRCMRAHGWTRHMHNRQAVEAQYPGIDPRFLFVNTGFSVRPTEINAAIGIEQLKKLETFNQKRNAVAKYWDNTIERSHLRPMEITEGTDPAWFGFPVLCNDHETRNAFKAFLEERGVETRPIICGNMARQPAFQHFEHRVAGNLENADFIMDCGLYWGSHPMMTQAEQEYVTQQIVEFFGS